MVKENVIRDKVEMANIAGLPVGALKPAAEVIAKIITSVGQRNARLEGEALKTFAELCTGFIQLHANNAQQVMGMLEEAFSKIDERSIVYFTKLIYEISNINIPGKDKFDLIKIMADKRAEMDKLEKQHAADVAKWATIFGGSIALAAVIFVGYKYARPKTIGDFLNSLIS